jgi:hypothetical protein
MCAFGIIRDYLTVNHSPDEMPPYSGPMGLMAVQTGKDIVRVLGIGIRELEGPFMDRGRVTIIGEVSSVSLIVIIYGYYIFVPFIVVLRILVAIQAEAYIIW